MLIGLTHVAIAVTNIDRSLAFYKKIPGIEEKFRLMREDGSIRLVYLEVGDKQFIEIFPWAKEPYQASTHAGTVHFCLEVDDMQAMCRQLSERGITLNGDPKQGDDGSLQVWINDPDGNPIEFHQYTKDSMQINGQAE